MSLPGALVPRHARHPSRRARPSDRDDPRRVARPRQGHVTGPVGRQMSQIGEPAAGRSIQAPPQRLDPRRIIGPQRAHHHHPAITQRLLRTRRAADSRHAPLPGSWQRGDDSVTAVLPGGSAVVRRAATAARHRSASTCPVCPSRRVHAPAPNGQDAPGKLPPPGWRPPLPLRPARRPDASSASQSRRPRRHRPFSHGFHGCAHDQESRRTRRTGSSACTASSQATGRTTAHSRQGVWSISGASAAPCRPFVAGIA